MKRILIRSGMRPTNVYTAEDIYLKDRTGFNNGNLAYQYSIYRTLWTDDAEIHADGLSSNPNLAEKINQNYDLYVIPLADAFRDDFRPALRNYTELIRRLKIPVIITGVGLRANYEPELDEGFAFDEDVTNFVKAVLEKSSQIGVRGQITADYLKKLGFNEAVDYRVIGCPSLYTFGRELKIRDVHLTEQSTIAINASPTSSEVALQFLNNMIETYKNYQFIPQHLDEFHLMLAGGPDISSETIGYPTSIKHKYYQEGRVKYFTSMPSWYDFMKNIDFSIGSRLHGNVIPTVVGTPNISFVQDARMRELASHHALTHITIKELEKTTNVAELLSKVDLKSAEKVQARNFDNYIDFLDTNGLDHIYKENRKRTSAPIDELVQSIDFPPSAKPITLLDSSAMLERIHVSANLLEERQDFKLRYHVNRVSDQLNQLKKSFSMEKAEFKQKFVRQQEQNNQLENLLTQTEQKLQVRIDENKKMNTQIKYYKGTLNRKAVRIPLKIADSLAGVKKKVSK
ncbi:polysaccharide pyruvyl transferase family protein [Listeria ivanovii]|uniref:polysaccharide pyruvyl transferase family protein n=1 Tax=Listeria ivanovii TaxID=1638 RepID=UPI001940BA69|nr:polysaccharide pyruvyl transferase family protein [Listeria ivanovii]MBM5608771.1 polysaccharide pyruvyl transferase family protein [Listeria ivanovii]MBM5636931.1 polysaccharide pyruvyl transferase family protein [Listeria ivanovii]MBM5706532.1 polysaccharide pyruvyl transferase family protein [Listeria ivanovii]